MRHHLLGGLSPKSSKTAVWRWFEAWIIVTTKKEKNLRHCTSYIYYIYHVKKTREIDWSFLCLQQFKQILKMKGEQSPETEMLKCVLKKIVKSGNKLKWTYFWRIFDISNYCVASAASERCRQWSCAMLNGRKQPRHSPVGCRKQPRVPFLFDEKNKTTNSDVLGSGSIVVWLRVTRTD